MLLWLWLFFAFFHVCEGTAYSIRVNPAVNSTSSAPCGTGAMQPCHSLMDAFKSVNSISNSTTDIATITIDAGNYTTCNISYNSYIIGTAAKNLVIIGNGTVNLNCTKENSAIFNLDSSGLNYTLINLNFMLGAVSVRGIEATLYSTSNSFLQVSECSFQAKKGSSTSTIGIYFGYGNNQLVFRNCRFVDLEYGLYSLSIQDNQVISQFPPSTNYNCSSFFDGY
jgi:hypothetical protein